MSKNRLCDKNHLCGPHLVLVITFQLGSGMMFQDASFTVSCCNLQHSLSTRKDCLCMRHATPCIHPATFTSAMQLHASALQLLWNWIGSKHLNQSNASIIKVFDFYWYQLHMSSGTTMLLNSCTHALCTCYQLWSALQYPTLSLWYACINPTDHATTALWAPHSQVQLMRSTPSHESCLEIFSWDYSCMSPHLSPGGIAACTPSAHLARNFSAWVVSSTPWSSSCGCSTSRGSLLPACKTFSLSSINYMSFLHFPTVGSSVKMPSTSSL